MTKTEPIFPTSANPAGALDNYDCHGDLRKAAFLCRRAAYRPSGHVASGESHSSSAADDPLIKKG